MSSVSVNQNRFSQNTVNKTGNGKVAYIFLGPNLLLGVIFIFPVDAEIGQM